MVIRRLDIYGFLTLLVLCLVSVYLRMDNLKAPLARDHERISAHSLITAQIWAEGDGPAGYHFSPIYSRDGAGNKDAPTFGGVVDEQGNNYYISYPPFCFILLYYFSYLSGGPDVLSLRLLSILIHCLTAGLIYWFFRSMDRHKEKTTNVLTAILAAALYVFAEGNLWFHGNLYFADMVVAPMIVLVLLLARKTLSDEVGSGFFSRLGLGLAFFLICYTEWIGVFLAAYTGLGLLLKFLVHKNKEVFLSFGIVAGSAISAVSLTLLQYGSIAGFQKLFGALSKKYAQRSGLDYEAVSTGHTIYSEDSLTNLKMAFDNVYGSIEICLVIALVSYAVIALLRRSKPQEFLEVFKHDFVIIGALAVLTHYAVFFNFNSVHEFSGLKTGLFLILLIGLILREILKPSWNSNWHRVVPITLSVTLTALVCMYAASKYLDQRKPSDIPTASLATAEVIASRADESERIFLNVPLDAALIFYSKHALFSTADTSIMKSILTYSRTSSGQYYYHEENELMGIIDVELKQGEIVLGDTIRPETFDRKL